MTRESGGSVKVWDGIQKPLLMLNDSLALTGEGQEKINALPPSHHCKVSCCWNPCLEPIVVRVMLAWWIFLKKYFFSMFCNANIVGAKKPCANAATPCDNAFV